MVAVGFLDGGGNGFRGQSCFTDGGVGPKSNAEGGAAAPPNHTFFPRTTIGASGATLAWSLSRLTSLSKRR